MGSEQEHSSTFDSDSLVQKTLSDPTISDILRADIIRAIFNVREQLKRLDEGVTPDFYKLEEIAQAFREVRSGPDWDKFRERQKQLRAMYMPQCYQIETEESDQPLLTHTARLMNCK